MKCESGAIQRIARTDLKNNNSDILSEARNLLFKKDSSACCFVPIQNDKS